MSAESHDGQQESEAARDPYIAAVARKIGKQELSDEGVEAVAEMGKTLTLICSFGDLKDPKFQRRAKGVANVLKILGQENLLEVSLRHVTQARLQQQHNEQR